MGSSSGALKAIGGISASSVTAIATGVGIDQNNKHQKALEEEKARQEELDKKRALEEEENRRILAKQQVFQEAKGFIEESDVGQTNWFDGGLYEFLDDQDIVFSISKWDGSELTDSNFKMIRPINAPSLNLDITIKVLISENSNQLKASDSGKIKIKHLKALYEDKDWTWSCHIKFSTFFATTEESQQTYELENKNKFFNSNNDGFFDVLKKDLTGVSDVTNKTKWKNIKKGLVKNCSDFEKTKKSKDKLVTNVHPTFMLKTKSDATDKKLYFIKSDKDPKAEIWFDGSITFVNSLGDIQS